LPDFDLDFCMARRDEVIRYIQSEYGEDRVAQIITFGKLQARAVLRDVGRVLEIPYGQVDRICKLVPNNPANPVTLQQAIDNEPALQAMLTEDESVARLVETALHLEGLYRHASTHAAGVVIGDRPLDRLVPLYRDPRSEMPVTQFNMKYVEMAGLVKFDILGLKTLTVLRRAVDLLEERGVEIYLSKLPLDDAATYQLLSEAETSGVFQMESSGMRDVLRKLRPDRFEDIIAVVALYRPGPMDNIPSYINRKHGREEPDYLHPSLEGILKETFGIMIYQEQVLQIAQALSGFTLGSADLLRRAMGKKIKKEMDAQNEAFVEGAASKEVDRTVARRIFDQVAKFAGYGFNKAHAAAYALVAYQTAYLKANYVVEFMAASMSFEFGNTEKIGAFRSDLDRLNITLLPPDINRSNADFAVEQTEDGKPAIRYALAALKNVGVAAMKGIVAERQENGPFSDLFDLVQRVDARMVNKRQLESLARAGAFDSLCDNRGQVFDAVETLIRYANAAQNDRDSSQVSLFGAETSAVSRPALPDADDWSTEKRLQQEFEAIGFYLSAHPLQSFTQECERLKVIPWIDIQNGLVRDSRIHIAGVVLGRRFTMSSRGSKMAFVQLSDASGTFEVTVFSEVLENDSELLESKNPLLLTVDVQTHQDSIRLTAQNIEPLAEAVAQATSRLQIFLETEEAIQRLANVIEQHGTEGRGRLGLVLDTDVQEVEMTIPGAYVISPAIRSAIKAIPGIRDIREL
jgi:DNA polymerase-3 subunit alpha